MKILLLGSGGREHALAWKLAQSPRVEKLYAAPGNPGIAQDAQIVSLDATDHPSVIDFCRINAVDLVVIGSSGESGEQPGRHGAVAERILSGSTRPVFVARTSESARPVRRIAVALDLSPISAEVYARALEAALVYEASLHVLVVAADPRNQDIGGIVGAALKVEPGAIQKRANRDVRKKLARIRDEVAVPFPEQDRLKALRKDEHDRVLFGDPAEQLIEDVVENNIDLLLIGREGYGRTALPMRVGRTARTLLGYAPCHLMVVPPGQPAPQ